MEERGKERGGAEREGGGGGRWVEAERGERRGGEKEERNR